MKSLFDVVGNLSSEHLRNILHSPCPLFLELIYDIVVYKCDLFWPTLDEEQLFLFAVRYSKDERVFGIREHVAATRLAV